MNESNPYQSLVLLVEDKELHSDPLAEWIKITGHEVLGPVESRVEALRLIDLHRDDIVAGVIDLKLPNDENPDLREDPNMGLNIAKRLKEIGKPVIIVSAGVFREILEYSLNSGFSYIFKEDIKKPMLPLTIELTILGCVVYSDGVRAEINRMIKEGVLIDPLDDMEWKILRLRVKGVTYEEISKETHFAESTLRSRISDIYKKINVNNTIEAVRWYDENAPKFGRA